MNKFHKSVASILAVLMLLTSAKFAVLAAEDVEINEQSGAVVLSASGDASDTTAGVLDGINIDWENYVAESTGTKLTRDYKLGLTDDYLYDSLPNTSTEDRFNYVRNQLPDELPVFAPYTKAEMAASKVKFYVSPNGSDYNDGSFEKPFKTPGRAVRAVNNLTTKRGGVTVYFREGVYSLAQTLQLGPKSSGSSEKDLVFYTNYEDESVTFTTAMTVTGAQLAKANDATFNRKVQEKAKSHIYSVDLSKLGYSDFGTITRTSRPTLYVDGIAYNIARWPDAGMTNMAQYAGADGSHGVVSVGDITTGSSLGPYTGVTGNGIEFQVANPRPFSWENTDNIWIYGYFYMEWAPYHFRIQSWNADKMTIKSYDYSNYGAQYIKEKNFYYYNILEELDNPGEWFLDNKTGMLYVYPSTQIKDDTLVQIVTTTNDIISLSGAKYTVINGITADMGFNGINVKEGSNCNIIQRCTIKNASNLTVNFSDATTYENGVTCSILFGKAALNGVGPQKDNRIAGNFIQNSYSKRISINGGGRDVVSHNLVTGFDTMGISTSSGSGAERIIEYNETVAGPDVGLDSGLFYNNGAPKNAGNIVRYNFFNRSTIVPRSTPYGIYLDDRSEGLYVYGNVMKAGYVNLHTGSNNAIYNNMIVDLADSRNAIANNTNYLNTKTRWQPVVLADNTTRYIRGTEDYYTTSWTSRFPYQYDWHRRMVQHKFNFDSEGYKPAEDEEGIFLSSPRDNFYKNNIAVKAKDVVAKVDGELNATIENNYLFQDPSVFNFTDWENGILDVDDEKLAELCPGVEPFKKNVQMGPIFDPALLEKPMELPEIHPAAPMDTDEIKIMPTGVTLQWNEAFGKSSYNVKVATDPEFKNIVFETETQAEDVALEDLEFGKQYYWTVSTNSWTEKVDKTPSVMKTATFVTYTFDEAVNMIELDTIEIENAFRLMKNFIEEGFIVEQGSPEAEAQPADMPLYKAGTKEKLYAFIEEGTKKKDEFKLQDDLDAYAQQWQKDFYILLAENALPYVVNIGQGSHTMVEENLRENDGGLKGEYLGDTLGITGTSSVITGLKRSLSAGATLAMSVKHEKLAEYTGIVIRGSMPVSSGITSVLGYCVIIKGDLIELQRYPKPETGAVLVDVVNDNKIVKGGEWADFTSEVKPSEEGVRVIVKINGETIFDYLDKDAPLDCYVPGYYGFMHQAKNEKTEYSGISDLSLAGSDTVSTASLERAIAAAESLEAEIVEGEPSGEPTYKVGTKAKLAAAIETAKAALSVVETKDDVTKATEALNAVLDDVKKNDANEFTYEFKSFDLSQWTATSPLATLALEENGKALSVTADEGEGTILLYNKPLASKQTMKFKLKYETVGDWHAIATRHVDKSSTHTRSRSYFFVIKPDLIEFQKYKGSGNGEIVVIVPNNEQIIKSGETYDIEVGSVNVDGGVLNTLKVNGETIIEYMDSVDPIYDEGYFSLYCHKTLGKVSISSTK